MQINGEQLQDDIYKIDLAGRMDLPGVDAIEAEFVKFTSAPQKHIVIDLAAVSFITSCGLRLLLSTVKSLHRRGGNLALLSPNPLVSSILQTAGINSVIPIANNLSEACAAASSPWTSPDDFDG